MRLEAATDDQLNIKKSKELAYYAATTAALDDILSNSDTPKVTSPSVTCVDVERVLFSPSSSLQQLENIIEDLKIDPENQQIILQPSQDSTQTSSSSLINKPAEIKSPESKLNPEQFSIWLLCDTFFKEKKLSDTGYGPKSIPLRNFIDGGPGTGKTFLLNCIKASAESSAFTVAATAFTGNAVKCLPKGISRTMHGTFGFQIKQNKATINADYQTGAIDQLLIRLRSHFDLKTLAGLFVDEISYISSENFG